MLLSKILLGCESVVKFALKELRFMFFALPTKFKPNLESNFCQGNRYMTYKFEEVDGPNDSEMW